MDKSNTYIHKINKYKNINKIKYNKYLNRLKNIEGGGLFTTKVNDKFDELYKNNIDIINDFIGEYINDDKSLLLKDFIETNFFKIIDNDNDNKIIVNNAIIEYINNNELNKIKKSDISINFNFFKKNILEQKVINDIIKKNIKVNIIQDYIKSNIFKILEKYKNIKQINQLYNIKKTIELIKNNKYNIIKEIKNKDNDMIKKDIHNEDDYKKYITIDTDKILYKDTVMDYIKEILKYLLIINNNNEINNKKIILIINILKNKYNTNNYNKSKELFKNYTNISVKDNIIFIFYIINNLIYNIKELSTNENKIDNKIVSNNSENNNKDKLIINFTELYINFIFYNKTTFNVQKEKIKININDNINNIKDILNNDKSNNVLLKNLDILSFDELKDNIFIYINYLYKIIDIYYLQNILDNNNNINDKVNNINDKNIYLEAFIDYYKKVNIEAFIDYYKKENIEDTNIQYFKFIIDNIQDQDIVKYFIFTNQINKDKKKEILNNEIYKLILTYNQINKLNDENINNLNYYQINKLNDENINKLIYLLNIYINLNNFLDIDKFNNKLLYNISTFNPELLNINKKFQFIELHKKYKNLLLISKDYKNEINL